MLATTVLLLLSALGCEGPPQRGRLPNRNAHSSAATDSSDATAVRDLSQDEASGGHTLRKHVGRSDDELRERLRHERHISAASTWSDRETAERAVGSALQQNRDKIERWSNNAQEVIPTWSSTMTAIARTPSANPCVAAPICRTLRSCHHRFEVDGSQPAITFLLRIRSADDDFEGLS